MLFEENEQWSKINCEGFNKTILNPFAFNQAGCQMNPNNNSILMNPISKSFFEYKENCFNQKLIEDFSNNRNFLNSSKIGSNNTLIIILNSIVMSVMFFCRLMLVDILKYASINHAFFLDSLIKYVNLYFYNLIIKIILFIAKLKCFFIFYLFLCFIELKNMES